MKRFCAVFLLLLYLPLLLPAAIHADAEPTVSTLLIETTTGTVLAEESADLLRPVGSLAKLMTAHLTACAIENGDLSTETILTAGDYVTGTKGAVIWLEQGDTITVDELLMGLLAGNANDAAAVLAKSVSGDIPTFVRDMNAAAFDLGMQDTRFTSPQGYDDPDAYSTARDMGKLACAVLRHDLLRPYLTTWRTFIRNETVEIVNENTFTRTLEGCLGLKAAHSEAAGECLAAAAEQNGMACAAIVLGCTDEDERFRIAKQLLNTGFASYQITIPGFSEEFLAPLTVKNGTASAVLLELSVLPALAIPKNAGETETVIVLPDYVQAPLSKGQQVGMVYFYHNKSLLCSVPLLTAEKVEEISFAFALQKVLRFLFI